ncbi:MAG: hypothetical protein M3384_05035 [Acidobacteriota bacterium]|nr:hypothetical protein [Acidobacteriota bacterium]
MKNAASRKIAFTFALAITCSVLVYAAVGLITQNLENAFTANPVPLDRLKVEIEKLDKKRRLLDMLRFFAPFVIFPFFAFFAVKPVFQFTKSLLFRLLIIIFFVTFPFIALAVLYILAFILLMISGKGLIF